MPPILTAFCDLTLQRKSFGACPLKASAVAEVTVVTEVTMVTVVALFTLVTLVTVETVVTLVTVVTIELTLQGESLGTIPRGASPNDILHPAPRSLHQGHGVLVQLPRLLQPAKRLT